MHRAHVRRRSSSADPAGAPAVRTREGSRSRRDRPAATVIRFLLASALALGGLVTPVDRTATGPSIVIGPLEVGRFAIGPTVVGGAIRSPFVPAGEAPVAPGVVHTWGAIATDLGDQDVQLVTVEPGRSEIAFEAALSNDRAGGLERTSAMAIRRSAEGHRVVAAINADVWSGSTLLANAPNGVHVERGELWTAETTTRAAFAILPDGSARIGSVRQSLTLETSSGTLHSIGRLNRAPGERIALFTARFGPRLSTALTGHEVVIGGLALPLAPTGSWGGTVLAVRAAGGGASIDPTTVVAVVPDGSPALAELVPGTTVRIAASITSGWEEARQIVSGRGFLVRSGSIDVSPLPGDGSFAHPRSALGITADGRVIMATVDGRRPDESLGVRLGELAELLLSRGAVEAINLDGGSSSTLAVRRPGDVDVSVVNTPSAGYEIAVTNGLQVVLTVPTGPLALLTAQPASLRLYPGQAATVSLIAQDAAYNPVTVAPADLTWSVKPADLGTIDATGRFRALAPGAGEIVVATRKVSTRIPVTVLPDTAAPVVGEPRATPTASGTIGVSVPVRLTWPAAIETESGLVRYELERSVDGGTFAPLALASPTATGAALGLPRDRTYRFRIRAVDRAGNVGTWVEGLPFRLVVAQESSTALRILKGTWPLASSPSYDGGRARTTRTTGAVARFTFTGSAVAWIAARSPVRGSARVSVDGGPAVTVSLYATTSSARRIVLARSWPTVGRHTVEITVVGTPDHPRVDIDAFVVHAGT